MEAGVGNFVDGVRAEWRYVGQRADREFDLGDAVAAVNADAVGCGKRDSGDLRIADFGGKLGEVVEGRIGRSIEDQIPIESLEAQGFTARSFAFC